MKATNVGARIRKLLDLRDGDATRPSGCGLVVAVLVLATTLIVGGGIGVPYCAARAWDRSRDLPGGDVRRFDVFAHLDEIAAFAGPGARLRSVVAIDVGEDGTLDLLGTTRPFADYGFDVPGPDETVSRVVVRISKPGRLRSQAPPGLRGSIALEDNGLEQRIPYRNFGMERGTRHRRSGTVPLGAVRPACDLVSLWRELKLVGAPAGGLAEFEWFDDDQGALLLPASAFRVVLDERCTIVK